MTCRFCFLMLVTAEGLAVCPSWQRFQAELLAALKAPGLGHTLQRWRPVVLKKALRSTEALVQELSNSASWERMSLQPPEEAKHVESREALDRLAKMADEHGLRNFTEDELTNVSCIGETQLGMPWRSHWGRLPNKPALGGQDRVRLVRPQGFGQWNVESKVYSKYLRKIGSPDFEKFHFFGPSPEQPCLSNLLRALASQELRSALGQVLGTSVALLPFLVRIYQHKRWYHYTNPHTDEMFAEQRLGADRNEAISSMVSVNLNLGGDELPGRGNGGLLWCAELPTGHAARWVPAPMGSAIMFRINNHSWHAVLPGRRAPTGRRLTLQIVYAAKVGRAGLPRAMGYDLGQRLPEIFEGGDPLDLGDGEAEADESRELVACHDMPTTIDHDCSELHGNARAMMESCSTSMLWQSACCGSCQSFWAERAVRLSGFRSFQQELAGFLATANEQFSRLLSSGQRMPLLALGTGGLSGQRASDVISYALKTGYRHLDSAVTYPSFPDALQSGFLKAKVPRGEVFISTKVPTSSMGYEATRRLMLRLKDELPGNYADLCMVHWPQSAVKHPEGVDPAWWSALERVGTWKALEGAYDMGICRSLGVSNFLKKHLEELWKYARVKPSVNQLEYTPTAPLQEELAFCKEHNVAISAFAWNRDHPLNQQELQDLTRSLLPQVTLSRELIMKVLMRWYMAQHMTPLFRSSREEVILSMARGLMEIPPLTEEQVELLRKPISHYPWEYYGGERPWNAAVIRTVE